MHIIVFFFSAEIFYPDNPVAFYQSVFLSRDRVTFNTKADYINFYS